MIDIDDRLRELLRGLLRKVVTDAAGDVPMLVSAGEFLGIGNRLRMRCPVRITFERDCGHVDRGSLRKASFELLESGLAFRQAKSPAIIMNHDVDVFGKAVCSSSNESLRASSSPRKGFCTTSSCRIARTAS